MPGIFKQLVITTFLVIIYSLPLLAQGTEMPDYPEVGKPCPDFVLKRVMHYPAKEVALKGSRGKWVILYFFASGCVSCFGNFPRLDRLQQEMKDRVTFFLVAKDDKYIRPTYEKFRKRYDLHLPIAYDTMLFKRFGINTVPHVLWIDDKGIVKAVTSSADIKDSVIHAFLEGRDLKLAVKPNKFQQEGVKYKYAYDKPLLTDHNGGEDTDFLYRSLLTDWNRDLGVWVGSYLNSRFGNKVQIVGASLPNLYYLAYGDTLPPWPGETANEPDCYGKFWFRPVLEVADSLPFQADFDFGRNMYSYSLIVPVTKASTAYLQEIMQCDLQHYFGYDVRVETRKMPYWQLTATESARKHLRTKGLGAGWNGSHAGGALKNAPVSLLLRLLWSYFQDEPPFIDETGITGHIDVVIKAIMTDFNDVKKALQKNGLFLQQGEKEMQVIVIRDHGRTYPGISAGRQ